MSRRAVLAGMGAALAAPASAHADGGASSTPWADLELRDAQDRRFRMAAADTPFTLIRLWANWCSTCMAELGSMPAVATTLAAHGVETILVSNPQDWVRDRQIAHDRGIGVRCARPSENNRSAIVKADLMAADGWFYVPRTVLFSRARQAAVWSHVGGLDWSDPRTLAEITRRLG